MENSAAEPISDREVETIAEALRRELGRDESAPNLRVDAGEKGRVWLAQLDPAASSTDIEQVAARVDELVDQLEEIRDELVWRVSVGGGEEPVVVCEFAEPPDPTEL